MSGDHAKLSALYDQRAPVRSGNSPLEATGPLRVCVVAHNRATLSELEALLRRAPQVQCAGSFEDLEAAVSRIPVLEPNVALIECQTASPSALDGLRRLRAAAETIACVLIIDAAAGPAWLRQALALGVSGLVPKPCSTEILLDAIRVAAHGGLFVDRQLQAQLFAPLGAPTERSPEALAVLTEREWAVLELEGAGLAYKQIADRLRISEYTVNNHLASIRHKLGVHTGIEALNKAYQRQSPSSGASCPGQKLPGA